MERNFNFKENIYYDDNNYLKQFRVFNKLQIGINFRLKNKKIKIDSDIIIMYLCRNNHFSNFLFNCLLALTV